MFSDVRAEMPRTSGEISTPVLVVAAAAVTCIHQFVRTSHGGQLSPGFRENMVFPITELAYLTSDHLYPSGPSPAGRVTDQMLCFRPTRNPAQQRN